MTKEEFKGNIGFGKCPMCGAVDYQCSCKLEIQNSLKTLKDLDHPVLDQMGKEAYTKTGLVDTNELKSEAVKWVKELRKHKGSLKVAYGFTKFFNITEDELK